ncbi:MAG: cell division protein SepF [Candidatus Woesearchaeota archaeon]
MAFFDRIKERFSGTSEDVDMMEDSGDNYLELDSEESSDDSQAKVSVRPFVLQDFADTKPILDILREGYTIALVNIKPLKEQDLVELKRSINKLKKTCDALDGDIAGFGDDWLCITPSFAQIHREKKKDVKDVNPEDF